MIANGVVATPSNDEGLIVANGVPQTRHNGLVIANGLSDRIDSYIGSPTARLSTVDGNAFAWISEKNLAPYLGHKIVVTDSAGKEATGWIKGADVAEALGSDLFDAGAGIFTAGTYSWAAYGTNTVENDANTLKITYGNSTYGAINYFRDASDLSSDLTVGKLYKFSFSAKKNGAGTQYVIVDSTGSLFEFSIIITGTTFDTYTQYFTARHANVGRIFMNAMGAGEIMWLDNLVLKEVTDIGADGAHIVSVKDGSTRNWASIDSGFNPHDIDFVNIYDK